MKRERIPRKYETVTVYPPGYSEEDKKRLDDESIERAARAIGDFYRAHGTIYAEGKDPRKDKK